MHIWNYIQRIKSVKMVIETLDKNQYSYFYILNSRAEFYPGSRAEAQPGWGGVVHQLSLSMLAFASFIKNEIRFEINYLKV